LLTEKKLPLKKADLPGLFWITILIPYIMSAETDSILTKIRTLTDSLETVYCPDSRTAVWTIEPEFADNQYFLRGETDDSIARQKLYELVQQNYPQLRFEKEIKLLPDDVMDGRIFAIAQNSVEVLYRSPTASVEMVTQTLRGLPLDILKWENGFYLVRTDDGYLGWVSEDGVTAGDRTFQGQWENAPQVVYIVIEGVVYSRPSLRSSLVSDVVMGNRFKLLQGRRKWTKVGFADGREGYLLTKSLQSLKEYQARSLNAAAVLATAVSLIGRPYMWGAASPKAMDCSGFTQIVFRHNGYLLPRDANMQVQVGNAIDTTDFPHDLQPGDLIFFSLDPDRITHVGIYLGEEQFIHCSGRVRIDSFNPTAANYNDYRRKTMRAVRRIIK
jgi:cell wall-associated NlpC family hydrolase